MKENTINKIKEVMLSVSKLNISEGIGFYISIAPYRVYGKI